MTIDPLKLSPIEVCRLLNSTPLGQVLREQQLRNHRTQAGHAIGAQRKVNLLRYAGWLMLQRHTRPVVDRTVKPIDLSQTQAGLEAFVGTLPLLPNMKRLKPRQIQAIAALLTRKSQVEVAKSISVSPNTISRWMQDPNFKHVYHLAARSQLESVYARAQAGSGIAMDSVLEIAQNGRRESDRLHASRMIFELAQRGERRSPPPPGLSVERLQFDEMAQKLSQQIRVVEHSTLPADEKLRVMNASMKTLLEASTAHELEVQLDEIDQILNNRNKESA